MEKYKNLILTKIYIAAREIDRSHSVILACANKGPKYRGEPSNMEILKLWVKTKLHVEFQFNQLRIRAAVAAGKTCLFSKNKMYFHTLQP
jgi:hypothetical protein